MPIAIEMPPSQFSLLSLRYWLKCHTWMPKKTLHENREQNKPFQNDAAKWKDSSKKMTFSSVGCCFQVLQSSGLPPLGKHCPGRWSQRPEGKQRSSLVDFLKERNARHLLSVEQHHLKQESTEYRIYVTRMFMHYFHTVYLTRLDMHGYYDNSLACVQA